MMRVLLPLLVLVGAGVTFWSVLAPEDLGLGAAVFPAEVVRRGELVDQLFTELAVLMGVLLVLTAVLLAFAVARGAGRRDGEGSARTGSTALEVVWTVIPAIALVGFLVRQLEVRSAFASAAELPRSGSITPPFVVGVDAHQFEWRFRYPGRDGVVWTADDLVSVSELAVPAGRAVELVMRSRDVIHSFFAPALRTKRDVVPGRDTRLSFVIEAGDLPMALAPVDGGEAAPGLPAAGVVLGLECAELCGWGHAAMVGRIRVLDDGGLDTWLTARSEERLSAE